MYICKTFWLPKVTWGLVNVLGGKVAGHVSKGDFHCESPNAVALARNGTIRTPLGRTIPDLFKLLKLLPAPILVHKLLVKVW